MVRAHLANITLHYSAICLFADDVALVLRCLRTQLGPLLEQMRAWHKASGLGLKLSKCVIIMLYGDEETYKSITEQHPEAEGMRTARAATYLGVEVGPEGSSSQWHTVSEKMSARLPDIVSAPSLTSCVVLFTSYATSLYSFKAQFADAAPTVRKQYDRAVQNITKAPWQAIPTKMLTTLKGLRFPVEDRDIDQLTYERSNAAQYGKTQSHSSHKYVTLTTLALTDVAHGMTHRLSLLCNIPTYDFLRCRERSVTLQLRATTRSFTNSYNVKEEAEPQ